MAKCRCGVELEGRRRKCDACKARPGREVEAPAVTEVETPTAVPAGLHDRGRALWVSLGLSLDTAAGQIALEACRLADRLDELDSVIAGKGVLNLMAFRVNFDELVDGERELHVTVGFQSVLTEARQQQATFKALLVEIADKAAPARPASGPVVKAKNPLDELKERRKAKGLA
jgi:hypothetical protein